MRRWRSTLALLLLVLPVAGEDGCASFCLGGPARDYAGGVATDAAGNLYVVGAFEETVDFDPGPGKVERTTAGAGSADAYVAKYDGRGRLQWVLAFGGTRMDYARCVAVDPAGCVVVAGHFSRTVDFDPSDPEDEHDTLVTKSGRNAFLAKYDGAGKFLWVRGFGDEDHAPRGSKRSHIEWSEDGRALAVDGQGNVYLTGLFRGTLDLDPGEHTVERSSVADSQDAYLVSVDTAGAFRWGVTIGGDGIDQGRAIAVGANGTLVWAGCFSGTVDFDPGPGKAPATSAGRQDACLVWFGSDGAFRGRRTWGGYGIDQVSDGALAVDAQGGVYAAGEFKGKADFDPGKRKLVRSSDGVDGYIVRYTPGADLDWLIRLGAGGADTVHALRLDAAGRVVVTGRFQKRVDFAPGSRKRFLGAKGSAGASHAFVAAYDAKRKLIWARSLGAKVSGVLSITRGLGLAPLPDGDVVVMGTFFGTLDADPGRGKLLLPGQGKSDLFLVRYDAKGTAVR